MAFYLCIWNYVRVLSWLQEALIIPDANTLGALKGFLQ